VVPPFRCWWCSPPGVTRAGGGAPALPAAARPRPSAGSGPRPPSGRSPRLRYCLIARALAAPSVGRHGRTQWPVPPLGRPRCACFQGLLRRPRHRAFAVSLGRSFYRGALRGGHPGPAPVTRLRCSSAAAKVHIGGHCFAQAGRWQRLHSATAPVAQPPSAQGSTPVGIPPVAPCVVVGYARAHPLPKPLQGPGLPCSVYRKRQGPTYPHQGRRGVSGAWSSLLRAASSPLSPCTA